MHASLCFLDDRTTIQSNYNCQASNQKYLFKIHCGVVKQLERVQKTPEISTSLSSQSKRLTAEFQQYVQTTDIYSIHDCYLAVRTVMDFWIVIECCSFQVPSSTASAQSLLFVFSYARLLCLVCTTRCILNLLTCPSYINTIFLIICCSLVNSMVFTRSRYFATHLTDFDNLC